MSLDALNQVFGIDALTLWMRAREWIVEFVNLITPYSTVFSLLMIVGIVYCFMRIEKIVHATKHEDEPQEGHGGKHKGDDAEKKQTQAEKRWQKISDHLDSDRESDWRLAILEADVLLDEMVTGMGYHGDSLGEKLKSIEKSDFLSLDKAWEAHSIRNKIAHEGAAFTLTDREAKRVIGLYEEVFKEFHFI